MTPQKPSRPSSATGIGVGAQPNRPLSSVIMSARCRALLKQTTAH